MKGRDLSLSPRREGVREQSHAVVVRFDLSEILAHFNETIADVEAQFETADLMEAAGRT